MTVRPRWLLWFALGATSCISYTEDAADPVTVATEVQRRPGGTFRFENAVQLAFRQNADLCALAARARAAGAAVEPTELQAEWRSESDMLAVMVDPLAMLNLGQRRAQNQELDAEAAAAVSALAAGRWRTAAALAEVFEVARVLQALDVPEIAVDADLFARAGLASPLGAELVRAAQARAAAERLELAAARDANLADFRRLVGLPDHALVHLVAPEPGWLPQPAASDAALLARPDVALAAAAFRVADAAFRRAVREQYPSLMIGPEIPLMGDPLQAMALLRLPIAAGGRAAAARDRRQAARAELEAACLDAGREASLAQAELTAAEAGAAAALAGQRASQRRLATALIEVQVDVDGFERLADAAGMAMRDTMERRQATTLLARARVRRAVAHGWPVAEEGS